MKHHPETNNQYYKLWLKYEPLSYLIFFISSFGNWVNVKKIESGFFILYFCLHKCVIEVLNKNISWQKMTMLLWHLQIRNLHLILGELKDYFINQFCFSSRLTGLTSMMSFQKSSRVSVSAFCPQIMVSKLLCF